MALISNGRAAGGLLLFSLAACGGRTGADLYSDGYDTSDGSSLPTLGGRGGASGASSNGASTSTGGTPSASGQGGTPSTGLAGAPGKGGTPGIAGAAGASQGGGAGADGMLPAARAACNALCIDPSSTCPAQFGSPKDCLSGCVAALGVQGGACQELGVQLVTCLRNTAANFGPECRTGATQAVALCATWIREYETCAGGATPVPPPIACSGTGSVAPGKCFQSQTCSDGTSFSVTCTEVGPNQSNCQCNVNGLVGTITLGESAIGACIDAKLACNSGIVPK